MRFEQVYSGSDRNLYIVTSRSGKRLLIECGVRWPDLQKSLNYDLNGIMGCFLSHEHADHSRAINDVMKAGIDVFSSEGTFEALKIKKQRRRKVIKNRTLVRLGEFEVFAFSTIHDAIEPLAFIIFEKKAREYLLFVTDTSFIRKSFDGLKFDIIAIECSYDLDVLSNKIQRGEIDEFLAKRLLESHLSNKTAIKYIDEFCNLSRCKEIHLLHMSGDNIVREKVRKEFEDRFLIETRTVCGADLSGTVNN